MKYKTIIWPGVCIVLTFLFIAIYPPHAIRILQGYFYDHIPFTLKGELPVVDKLLIIEFEEDSRAGFENPWSSILEELIQYKPGIIGLVGIPSDRIPESAQDNMNLVLGIFPEGVPGVLKEGKALPSWGIVETMPSDHGVLRTHKKVSNSQWQEYPMLETVIAERYLNHASDINDSYGVNFRLKPNGLPRIQASQIFEKKIPDDFLKDKIVLISPGSYYSGSIYVPLSHTLGNLSRAEFAGYAILTMISHHPVSYHEILYDLICYLLFVIPALYLYRLRSHVAGLVGNLLLLLSAVITAVILFLSLDYPMPVVSISLAHAVLIPVLLFSRISLDHRMQQSILLDASADIRETLLPSSLLSSKAHWENIDRMLKHFLTISKNVFLEVAAEGKISVVAHPGCELSDLSSQSFELSSSPFREIAEGSSTGLFPYSIFKELSEEETAYVISLNYGGILQGFWCLVSVSPDINEIKKFQKLVNAFSREIAELLYHRNINKMREREMAGGLLPSFLKPAEYNLPVFEVGNSFKIIKKRYELLEDVFNNLQSASILYDLFGQVLYINTRMSEILSGIGFAPYQRSAFELLKEVSGQGDNEIKKSLSLVTTNREQVTLSITLPGRETSTLIMRIRPLLSQEEDQGGKPFGLEGIQFELYDITHLKKLFDLKDLLYNYSNIRIRQHLEGLTLAADVLSMDELKEADRMAVAENLSDRVNEMCCLVNSVDEYVQLNIFNRPLIYPVPANEPFKQAHRHIVTKAEEKQIQWDWQMPTMPDLVLVDFDQFVTFLESLLGLFIEDAVDASTLLIKIEETDSQSIIRISNTGFGIPNEDLNAYLSENSSNNPAIEKIQNGIEEIQEWKGNVLLSSEVGQGLRCEITLQKA